MPGKELIMIEFLIISCIKQNIVPCCAANCLIKINFKFKYTRDYDKIKFALKLYVILTYLMISGEDFLETMQLMRVC